MGDIKQILKRVKVSLYLLITVLALVSLYLLVLLKHSADELNEVSSSISQSILETVIAQESDKLGALVKDYSIWNDAVNYLILEQNPDFIRDNFDGEHLKENFGVAFVDVYDEQYQNLLSFSHTRPDKKQQRIQEKQQAFKPLMRREYPFPLVDATLIAPSLGFIEIENKIHMAACSIIKPQNELVEGLVLTKIYGYLCMGKSLDKAMLAEWEKAYYFQGLSLVDSLENTENVLFHQLISTTGSKIGVLKWHAQQPGVAFINERLFSVSSLLLLITIVLIFFGFSMRRYIRLGHDMAINLEDNAKTLEKLAHQDSLTGLANRYSVLGLLTEKLQTIETTDDLIAVLFIDLDGFKSVNDRYGHIVGDELLAIIAKRFVSCIHHNDIAARYAGDEFLIFIHVNKHQDIDKIAKRILTKTRQSCMINGISVSVTASIGIAVAPTDDVNALTLIAKSDQAMYKSKSIGKNQYCYYADIN